MICGVSASILKNSLAVSVLLVVLVVGAIVFANALRANSMWNEDFGAYYDAAQRVVAGDSPYTAASLAGPFQPVSNRLYLYPPPFAVLMQPMTLLPEEVATDLWFVLKFLLIIGMCALLPVSRRTQLAAFAVIGASSFVFYDLALGNVSILVTFLAVIGWRYLDKPLGAVALGLTMALRPTMALLGVWFLLRGRGAPVAWMAATIAALTLVALPFVGLAGHFDYLSMLRNVSEVRGASPNLDVGSILLRFNVPSSVADVASAAAMGMAAGAVLLSLRRDREVSFVVAVSATLILSPLLWQHYMLHLLLPAALLAERGRRWGLALPLLGWLPHFLLPLVAMAGVLAPLLAPSRGEAAGFVLDRLRQASPARSSEAS